MAYSFRCRLKENNLLYSLKEPVEYLEMEVYNVSSEFPSTLATNQTSSSNNGTVNEPSTSKKVCPGELPFDCKDGKKHDITQEQDINGVKPPKQKKMKSFREDEGKDTLQTELHVPSVQQCQQPLQMQPTTSYYTSGYGASDHFNILPSQSNVLIPQSNNTMNEWGLPDVPGKVVTSTTTSMNPYPYTILPDPSLYGMMPPAPSFCPMPMMNKSVPSLRQKTVKVFTNCVLYPPPPSTPLPSRRKRPNGCQTVFVKGLPEKMTEDMVKEVFSECGEIASIRMSTKNFCHIRFISELHVDQALLLSDYRIIIENNDDPVYYGRLHVDFAVSHDDQLKCERLMRKMSWAARHANLDDPFRPLMRNSSEREAAIVGNPSQSEDSFMLNCQVLITWLERRERIKRNSKCALREQFVRLMEEKSKLLKENILLREQLKTVTDGAVMIRNEGERKRAELLETYRSMQQIYMETQMKLADCLKEKLALESKVSVSSDKNNMASACNPGVVGIGEKEAGLVTLIATFLNVHPFGASIDYICSYLAKLDKSVSTRDVETLMKKFKTVFKEESTFIDANLMTKWFFLR